MVVLADIDVPGLRELIQLALDHSQGDLAQQPYDLDRVVGERHTHRLDVEVVAQQHRDVVAPPAVHGETAPSEIRVVDDVVVHQRRRVDELDDRRVGHGALTLIAGESRRHQQQRRANALAAARLEIASDLRDELDPRLDVAVVRLLDGIEIGSNRLEDMDEISWR